MSNEDLFITVRYSDNFIKDQFTLEDKIKIIFPFQDNEPPERFRAPPNTILLFKYEPEFDLVITPKGEYERAYNRTTPAKETFKKFVNELILYDKEGNVVLMLDDIQENNFEYEGLPEVKLWPCIMVTPEMVQAGREKYAKISTNINYKK